MSITLDLRLIDHDRIAVRGREVVNAAIRDKKLDALRQYLETMPVDVDQAVVDFRVARLAKLRELRAPTVIIENEERLLRYANGDAYQPRAFQNASLDELRELLGTWCWPSHSFSLDAWRELQWFFEPGIGPHFPLFLERPRMGDPQQTVLDKALQGAFPYPVDDLGDPVIRTLGSTQEDCYGYNPPDETGFILEALKKVDPSMWTAHVPFRCELYRQDIPDMDDQETFSRVEDDLSYARETFSVLMSAYSKAVEKGFGVSCEYSL